MTLNQDQIPTFSSPHSDALFLASQQGLRTYGDLRRYTDFFQDRLKQADQRRTELVGFLMPSCDELIMAIAACWRLGIPFTCLNPDAPQSEIEDQLQRLAPGVLVLDRNWKKKISYNPHISVNEIKLEKGLAKRKTGPQSGAESISRSQIDPEQVFGYFFTSGTSSSPKIVPLKRRQMYYAAAASAKNFRPDPNHFWLLCLPLNHIGGISIIIRSLLYGTGIYRMDNFDQSMVKTFLSENKLFQAASLVPTMLKRLIDIPVFQTHHNFKAILLGGGPIDSNLLERAVEKGIPLVSSYGMTETCAQISANPLLKPSGMYKPMKSVGNLFEPNNIQIRDENGEVMSPNTSGSIWLNGPQVFDGYIDNERNAAVFDENGWFDTGDYGHINVNGHLFIESRRSDLIISGGENISPTEIETTLEQLEAVGEAAVLGLPDEEWGQRVVAVVVPHNGEPIQTEQIQQQLRERLSSFKIPKQIMQVDALPKNRTGKVIRKDLMRFFE